MIASPQPIDGVVREIERSGLPTLIFDSCVALDIVRAPFRREIPNETVVRAAQIVGGAALVELVIASLVPQEVAANLPAVTAELQKHCERLVEHAADADTACAALGVPTRSGLSRVSYVDLMVRLPELANQLIGKARVLAAQDAIELRAYRRAVDRKPPSTRGNQGKDCQVYEETLELSRQLRALGYAEKIVFCSSNTQDYCEPRAVPHSELAPELAAVGVSFTTNLPWACSELGL